MINYKEMRIGNFFLANGLLQSVSAISVVTNKTQDRAIIGYYVDNELLNLPADSEYLQPIPINNEILKRCGFEFHSYFKLWQKMKKVLGTGVEMEINSDYSALDYSHRPILKEIEYLHHLQNLYYALKRNELVVDIILNKKLETDATAIQFSAPAIA